MPSLIDVNDDDCDETAPASAMARFCQELDDEDCNPALKDSLVVPPAHSNENEDSHNTQSATAGAQKNQTGAANAEDCSEQNRSNSVWASRESPSRREKRQMGPKERLYREKYADFVANKIAAAGGTVRDYRTMNASGKQREQERVMWLLRRLKIGSRESQHLTQFNGEQLNGEEDLDPDQTVDPSIDMGERRDRSDDGTLDPSLQHSQDGQNKNDNCTRKSVSFVAQLPKDDTLDESEHILRNEDGSIMLLSPPMRNPPAEETLTSKEHSSDSSTASIEVPRASRLQDSPASLRRKRLASSSGKKGTGLLRSRLAEDVECHFSSLMLESPSPRLPPGPSDPRLFPASQSPISPHRTTSPLYSPTESAAASPTQSSGISFGDDFHVENKDGEDSSSGSDRIECTRISTQPNHALPLGNNVALRDGATFHFNPLQTEFIRSSGKRFLDPLDQYPDGIRQNLLRVYDRLSRRDNSSTRPQAIVLSMDQDQIFHMVLQFLLQRSSRMPLGSATNLQKLTCGGTLIVAREKEALDGWGQVIREGSGFSLLNHSTMPLKERKTLSSSSRLAKYDVVTTTYDALKSPDITLNVDFEGRVSVEQACDGWLTRRSQADSSAGDLQRMQLSVLHTIRWRRVVFVDCTGRQSYLTKPDTSRVMAAKALDSESIFAFFLKAEEDGNNLEFLLKSHKNADAALVSVLRLHGENKSDVEKIKSASIVLN